MGTIEIITPDGSRTFGETSHDSSEPLRGTHLLYAVPYAGVQTVYIQTGWMRDDPSGSLAFWSRLREFEAVDVVLRSDPAAAFDALHCESALDLSVRFEEVPVVWAEQSGPLIRRFPPAPGDLDGVPAERVPSGAP